MHDGKFCTRHFSAKSRLTRERWNFRSSISLNPYLLHHHNLTFESILPESACAFCPVNRLSERAECVALENAVSNLFQAWIFERPFDNFYIVCITLIIFHMEIWVGILFSTVLHGVPFQDSELRGHPGVSHIFPRLRRQIARSEVNKIMLATLFFVRENL